MKFMLRHVLGQKKLSIIQDENKTNSSGIASNPVSKAVAFLIAAK